MSWRTWTVTGLAALALVVSAGPGQQKPFLRDKQGKFAVFGVTSQETEFGEDGRIAFTFVGSPVSGFSKDQGLEFRCRRLDGTIFQASGGAMTLEKGTAQGQAVVTITQGPTASVVESERIELVDGQDQAVARLPGAFTFTNRNEESGASRRVNVRAASGQFVLDPLKTRTQDPVRTATVQGPVTVTVVSTKSEKGATSKSVLTAKGQAMTYDRSTRKLVVTGNVEIEGEQTPATGRGFQGVMTVERVEITLTEKFEVARVSTRSGSATLREPGGG